MHSKSSKVMHAAPASPEVWLTEDDGKLITRHVAGGNRQHGWIIGHVKDNCSSEGHLLFERAGQSQWWPCLCFLPSIVKIQLHPPQLGVRCLHWTWENSFYFPWSHFLPPLSLFLVHCDICFIWTCDFCVGKYFTAIHPLSAKYYQLLSLHGRRWRKWRKIKI